MSLICKEKIIICYDLSSEIFVPSFLCLLEEHLCKFSLRDLCKFSLRDPKLEKVFFVLI
jgi:hypothetical protein